MSKFNQLIENNKIDNLKLSINVKDNQLKYQLDNNEYKKMSFRLYKQYKYSLGNLYDMVQFINNISGKHIKIRCKSIQPNEMINLLNKPNIKTLVIILANAPNYKINDVAFKDNYTILKFNIHFAHLSNIITRLPYHIFERNLALYKRKRFTHTKAINM